jgi:heme/copper-type cytochrome/quinol oxidase subunit 4
LPDRVISALRLAGLGRLCSDRMAAKPGLERNPGAGIRHALAIIWVTQFRVDHPMGAGQSVEPNRKTVWKTRGTVHEDKHLGADQATEDIGSYVIGLDLASILTVVSFFIAGTTLVWDPGIAVALAVLAIARLGVHLVFFIYITTGPNNLNNVPALAFGVMIVLLVRWLTVDHGAHEPKYDACGSDHTYAAMSALRSFLQA